MLIAIYTSFMIIIFFQSQQGIIKASFTSIPPSKTFYTPPYSVALRWTFDPSFNPVTITFAKFDPANNVYDDLVNYIIPIKMLTVFLPGDQPRMDLYGQATLRINDTTAADAGKYQCTLTSNTAVLKSVAELAIQDTSTSAVIAQSSSALKPSSLSEDITAAWSTFSSPGITGSPFSSNFTNQVTSSNSNQSSHLSTSYSPENENSTTFGLQSSGVTQSHSTAAYNVLASSTASSILASTFGVVQRHSSTADNILASSTASSILPSTFGVVQSPSTAANNVLASATASSIVASTFEIVERHSSTADNISPSATASSILASTFEVVQRHSSTAVSSSRVNVRKTDFKSITTSLSQTITTIRHQLQSTAATLNSTNNQRDSGASSAAKAREIMGIAFGIPAGVLIVVAVVTAVIIYKKRFRTVRLSPTPSRS